MKSEMLAIRSIGAEFANQLYVVVVSIVLVGIAVMMALNIWLISLSDWWWLLFIVLVMIASVAIGVLVVIKLVILSVTPTQSAGQKKQAKDFVSKLRRLAEVTSTPKFILLFRIVRDIAAPRSNGFIGTISSDGITIKRDFSALANSFKP